MSTNSWLCVLVSSVALLWWKPQVVSAMAVNSPTVNSLPEQLPVSTALLNMTYTDSTTGQIMSQTQYGHYAVASPINWEFGRVIHVLTEDGANHGCLPLINAPHPKVGKWIALIQRGKCKFHDKVNNAAFIHNASAVVVYNYVEEDDLLVMNHFIDTVVSVFVHKKDGDQIADLVDSGVAVYMNISLEGMTVYDIREPHHSRDKEPYKVQPLLIISVTMIACLIAGLSALLVYGIRRAKIQRKKTRRHIVFTLNDHAAHQRLLLSDLHDYVIEPNNNDPNHNIVTPHMCYRPK